MRNFKLGIFILSSVLCLLSSGCLAADRVFNESWDASRGSSETLDLQWFGGDSIDYTHRVRYGSKPVVLTNANQTLVWQVTGSGEDKTNSYLAVTGAVQQSAGVVEFAATPAQANLAPGDYLGYVRSVTIAAGAQTNAVTLCYQEIEVVWSPESDTLATASALPVLDFSGIYGDLSSELGVLGSELGVLGSELGVLGSELGVLGSELGVLSNTVQTLETGKVSRTDATYTQTVALASNAVPDYDASRMGTTISNNIVVLTAHGESYVALYPSFVEEDEASVTIIAPGGITLGSDVYLGGELFGIDLSQIGAAAESNLTTETSSRIDADALKLDLDGGNIPAYPSEITATGDAARPLATLYYDSDGGSDAGWPSYASEYNSTLEYANGDWTCQYRGSQTSWSWPASTDLLPPNGVESDDEDSDIAPEGDPSKITLAYDLPAAALRSNIGAASTGSVAAVQAEVDALETNVYTIAEAAALLDGKAGIITNVDYTVTAPAGGADRVYDPTAVITRLVRPSKYLGPSTEYVTPLTVESDSYGVTAALFDSSNDQAWYIIDPKVTEINILGSFATGTNVLNGARIIGYLSSFSGGDAAYIDDKFDHNDYCATNGNFIIDYTIPTRHQSNDVVSLHLKVLTPSSLSLEGVYIYGVKTITPISAYTDAADVLSTLLIDIKDGVFAE